MKIYDVCPYTFAPQQGHDYDHKFIENEYIGIGLRLSLFLLMAKDSGHALIISFVHFHPSSTTPITMEKPHIYQ